MTLDEFYEAFRRVAWDFASDRQGRLRDGQWRCPIEAVGEALLGERLGYRLAAARLRLSYDAMTDIISAADGSRPPAPSAEVRRVLLGIVQRAEAERDVIADARRLVEHPPPSRLMRARRRLTAALGVLVALF